MLRQTYPHTDLDRQLGMLEIEAPRISRQSAHESGKVFSPTHRPPIPTSITPRTHFSQKLGGHKGHNATGSLRQ